VERDATYKDILKVILDEFVQRGIELAKNLKSKYFTIASQSSHTVKERSDEISTTIKKSEDLKHLSLI